MPLPIPIYSTLFPSWSIGSPPVPRTGPVPTCLAHLRHPLLLPLFELLSSLPELSLLHFPRISPRHHYPASSTTSINLFVGSRLSGRSTLAMHTIYLSISPSLSPPLSVKFALSLCLSPLSLSLSLSVCLSLSLSLFLSVSPSLSLCLSLPLSLSSFVSPSLIGCLTPTHFIPLSTSATHFIGVTHFCIRTANSVYSHSLSVFCPHCLFLSLLSLACSPSVSYPPSLSLG